METVSFQRISDAKPTHIITACEDADTCPGCGAGYHAGFIECEYCKRPVMLEVRGLPWGVEHGSEFAMPASVAAMAVPRDDGTTGFEFG